MRKSITAVVLFALLLVFCIAPVQASSDSMPPSPGVLIESGDVEIVIKPDAIGITSAEIDEIVASHPEAGRITILDHHEAAPAITPYSFTNISKTVTDTNVLLKRSFVISVARGQTVTLSKTWTDSVSASVTGMLTSGQLGLTSSIQASYSVSNTFTGPEAPYNSRDYYVRFYGRTGTWRAYFIYDINPARQEWVDGTFVEPTHYSSYCVDKKV